MPKPINDTNIISKTQLNTLMTILGYQFKNNTLLTRSLSHRSYCFEQSNLRGEDNETLEFLGDAVLDLVISALLIKEYPKMSEGNLTKLRAALVQESHLTLVAKDIQLDSFLLLGKGEENSGGREKASILSSTYEAVVGAIFMDGGFDQVEQVIVNHFRDRITSCHEADQTTDAKSMLQELTQQRTNEAPTYVLDKAEGPDHDKTFTISVLFQGSILATATAKSKKAAEQKAASVAYTKLHNK